ncbi:MAG: prohibitin family protein [Desulfitobacteriia bacterium]
MDDTIVTRKRHRFWLPLVIILVFAALIITAFAFKGFVIVEPGNRGVVVQLGAVKPKVLNEGFHIIIPFIQKVVPVDVRVQKSQSQETTSSRDLQVVNTVIAVNYRLDPENVNKLYQEVGLSYTERIVEPAIGESLKAVTAQYTAEELISKRSEVSFKVKETLAKKLSTYYIKLDEINITEFDFSPEFNAAIEQKQIAEQQALKASLDLQRIEIEARQKIEQARAEAEALKLQKDYITPELVNLRKIEAQLEAIKKWDGKLPAVTGNGVVPFIDLKSLE